MQTEFGSTYVMSGAPSMCVSFIYGDFNMSENNNEKKSHGFLKFLIALVIIWGCLFGFVKFVQYQQSNSIVDGNGTIQSNKDGNTQLLSRSANNNDVIIDYDLDLANLGVKYIVMPQTDISNLQITIYFLDKNKNILTSKVENLGNVKQGVQVNSSISLFDLGLSVAWNTEYNSFAVTGGTVSYFA